MLCKYRLYRSRISILLIIANGAFQIVSGSWKPYLATHFLKCVSTDNNTNFKSCGNCLGQQAPKNFANMVAGEKMPEEKKRCKIGDEKEDEEKNSSSARRGRSAKTSQNPTIAKTDKAVKDFYFWVGKNDKLTDAALKECNYDCPELEIQCFKTVGLNVKKLGSPNDYMMPARIRKDETSVMTTLQYEKILAWFNIGNWCTPGMPSSFRSTN
uniref:AlNc14C396G11335 protein n=1 Tax=Albugo laibachii Nc14 TaxID=890382 RepID=F0WYS5_9STRA|nr:AlNc14C396G11335 [Albugo laibachii Nc14]|eukprot:CCA26634.1 AlNc14C396G11335 [Albugo laibachii Nc14]